MLTFFGTKWHKSKSVKMAQNRVKRYQMKTNDSHL